MEFNLGVIGCGVMANAICAKVSDSVKYVYDIDAAKSADFASKFGAIACDGIQELLDKSDVILLAVKPQHSAEILANCNFSNVKTLISIMAGVKIAKIRKSVSNKSMGIVRVMPNLPIRVGFGMAALAFSKNVKAKYKEFALNMFSASGSAIELDEKQFDAVTGVSGSGPAYVFMFIKGLIEGGMAMGLDEASARKLAEETVIGAAEYSKSLNLPLDDMISSVCSKGGTTIEAVDYYRSKKLENIIAGGVKKAALKSKKLSK